MTREEFYKLTDILDFEVLGNFMHGGEASEVIAQFEEAVENSCILKEEPVSDIDFEQELYKAFGQVKDFTLGMQIAKRFYEMGKQHQEPVSEDLGEYVNELSKQFPEVSFAKLSRIAVRVAKWQEQQDQSTIELAEDHAMLAGMEKMKEQMMEKAVIMEAHEEYGELWGDIRRCNTEKGKRYKVIIIKED